MTDPTTDPPTETEAAPPPSPSPTDPKPLQAKADRPADSGWREPPWVPARGRSQRPSSLAAIVVGLILIAIGLWYFLDRTLGIALPRVSWGSLWPLILIVIGAVVLVRSFERK